MYENLLNNLRTLVEAIIADFSAEINRLGISEKQAEYLELINADNNSTPKKLADALKLRKPTVTTGINILLEKGLVKKVQSKSDKRVFRLELTARGRQKLEKIHHAKKEVIQKHLSKLTGKDLKQFGWIINKIILFGNLE